MIDPGAAVSSMNFFMLMILEVILGLAVAAYTAHSFLTVLVDTAAGTDHVCWPAEPFTDWLWKPVVLLWVAAVWVVPLGLILTLFKFRPLQISLITLGFFWLAMPVGLLSTLSAASRWIVFRPLIAWSMLRHPGATLLFLFSTEFLLAGWATVIYLTIHLYDLMLLLPVPALVTAVVLFLYARLLGRFAWVMNQRQLGQQAEVEEAAKEANVENPWPAANPPPQEAPRPVKSRRAKAIDPWAVPAAEDDEAFWKKGLPLDVQQAGSYNVATHEAPPPMPPQPARRAKRPPAVYAAEPVRPAARPVQSVVADIPQKERELAERPETPPPAFPLVSGVYTFPTYPATVGPLLTIALGLWLMGLVLRLLVSSLGF